MSARQNQSIGVPVFVRYAASAAFPTRRCMFLPALHQWSSSLTNARGSTSIAARTPGVTPLVRSTLRSWRSGRPSSLALHKSKSQCHKSELQVTASCPRLEIAPSVRALTKTSPRPADRIFGYEYRGPGEQNQLSLSRLSAYKQAKPPNAKHRLRSTNKMNQSLANITLGNVTYDLTDYLRNIPEDELLAAFEELELRSTGNAIDDYCKFLKYIAGEYNEEDFITKEDLSEQEKTKLKEQRLLRRDTFVQKIVKAEETKANLAKSKEAPENKSHEESKERVPWTSPDGEIYFMPKEGTAYVDSVLSATAKDMDRIRVAADKCEEMEKEMEKHAIGILTSTKIARPSFGNMNKQAEKNTSWVDPRKVQVNDTFDIRYFQPSLESTTHEPSMNDNKNRISPEEESALFNGRTWNTKQNNSASGPAPNSVLTDRPSIFTSTDLGKTIRSRNFKFNGSTGMNVEEFLRRVPIKKEHRHLTAFTVPGRGLYEFVKMAFGLAGAPATFQTLMDKIISPKLEPHAFAYHDDIIVATETFEEHKKVLEEVLARLTQAGLTINKEKSHFCCREIRYLGVLVDRDGYRPDPTKIEPIVSFPIPRTLKQLRPFLGAASCYRKFIEKFATITEPLPIEETEEAESENEMQATSSEAQTHDVSDEHADTNEKEVNKAEMHVAMGGQANNKEISDVNDEAQMHDTSLEQIELHESSGNEAQACDTKAEAIEPSSEEGNIKTTKTQKVKKTKRKKTLIVKRTDSRNIGRKKPMTTRKSEQYTVEKHTNSPDEQEEPSDVAENEIQTPRRTTRPAARRKE
ncbi:unnamed protein product [Trichogramma brassicae]|uniref:Reverse transcriptase domain-containing protein n=1 Tax=Trichogramma brassicae TaxID=86971 RepID=A0A6H5J602_9HYME|nr:unnamed protein product [Trichogramma brassicae]